MIATTIARLHERNERIRAGNVAAGVRSSTESPVAAQATEHSIICVKRKLDHIVSARTATACVFAPLCIADASAA